VRSYRREKRRVKRRASNIDELRRDDGASPLRNLRSGYPEDRVDGRSTALGFYFQSTAELPQSVSHAAEA
ncbi:MAG: hypothetical protein WBX10_19835, partial [Candidatus Sulfotelmatobacter sp.]